LVTSIGGVLAVSRGLGVAAGEGEEYVVQAGLAHRDRER
jgi:hypothetical protein